MIRPTSRRQRQRRDEVIDDIVERITHLMAEGGTFSCAGIIQEHPHLMPELGRRLEQLETIERAAAHAKHSSTDSDVQATPDPFSDDLRVLREGLADYEIQERLRHGGQGVVYRALQRTTRRPVAVKILLHGVFASDRQRARFQREVELVSRLKHPNIVTLYESGVVHGRHYYAMEYVEGLPIDDYVLWNRLPPRERVRLMIVVCRAVAEAHKRGIIHRDLKPSNILVDHQAVPHILDFGLAKDTLEGEVDHFSREGQVIGTTPFLSPEQVAAHMEDVDVRSDVYALGVTLYFLMAGRFPYPVVGDPLTVRDNILHLEPTPLFHAMAEEPGATVRRQVGHDLQAILKVALAKEPGRRYQSAAELADDLQRYLDGQAVRAKARDTAYTLRKAMWRHRILISASAISLIALGGFGVTVARLILTNQAATATGEVRTSAERRENITLLNAIEAKESYARIIERIAADSHPEWSDDARRLLNRRPAPSIESWQWATTQPKDLLRLVRSPEVTERETAGLWLNSVGTELDQLSQTLRQASFSFTLLTADFRANSPLVGSAYTASLACTSLMARACLRFDEGDRVGSLADARTAYRLIIDVGDGVSLQHKGLAGSRMGKLLCFLQHALEQMFRDETDHVQWTRWISRLTSSSGPESAIPYLSLSVMQSVNGACRVDKEHPNGFIDLDELDNLTGGVLTSMCALTDGNRLAARSIHPDEFRAAVDRFIGSTVDMNALPLNQLLDRVSRDQSDLRELQASSPVYVLLPWIDDSYVFYRLRRSTLGGIRVAATAMHYKTRFGAWPKRVDDLALSDADCRDPLTGEPYYLDFRDGVACVMSSPVEHLAIDRLASICSLDQSCRVLRESSRVVYFSIAPLDGAKR